MRRILVTGNAGSGKSTLAKQIATMLDMPCHGLDRIVWKSGWRKAPMEERDDHIRQIAERDEWVIDGVSLLAQGAADTVVFLDVPRRVSFLRVAKRNWRYLFRSRPDLPPDCPEWRIIPTLCRIIWNFPGKVRPKILDQARLSSKSQEFIHVRSAPDLSAFLKMVGERLSDVGDPLSRDTVPRRS